MGVLAIDRDEMIRGDDYAYTIQLQVAGVAYNGSTSTWSAKLRETTENSTVIATMTVDTTDIATGGLIVKTTDTITAALTQRTVVWDLQETKANGDIFTWVQVLCTVPRDATR